MINAFKVCLEEKNQSLYTEMILCMYFTLYFIEGMGKKTKQGIGPDTCLLLDTSGSMEGANFEEMITIAKTFIKGILFSTLDIAILVHFIKNHLIHILSIQG